MSCRVVTAIAVLMMASLACSPCVASANPADINNDGVVDGGDFTALLVDWHGFGPGNIDNLDNANLVDFDLLHASWGWTAPPLPLASGGVASLPIVISEAAGWRMKAGVDVPLSLNTQGESIFHNTQNDSDWYFYVPAGTTTISYYPGNHGGTQTLYAPDGSTVATVAHDGVIKNITVPAGADGGLWRLYGAVGAFWFYNLPNQLGVSKNQLMVPREVAISDGLTIR